MRLKNPAGASFQEIELRLGTGPHIYPSKLPIYCRFVLYLISVTILFAKSLKSLKSLIVSDISTEGDIKDVGGQFFPFERSRWNDHGGRDLGYGLTAVMKLRRFIP